MKKLLRFSVWILLIGVLTACVGSDDTAVQAVLNQRSQALQDKNIQQYAMLIADNYMSRGRDKKEVVDEMKQLFRMFNDIQMETYNRIVRVLVGGHAECEQSYTLKVYADGVWRNITHREQIELQNQKGVWKITAGL